MMYASGMNKIVVKIEFNKDSKAPYGEEQVTFRKVLFLLPAA